MREGFVCETNKTVYDTQKTGLNNLIKTVDTEIAKCFPATVAEEKFKAARAEYDTYIEKKRGEIDQELAIFEKTADLATQVKESGEPLRQYAAELRSKRDVLVKENEQLDYLIRSNRRRFMDSDPQDELPTVLGLKTSDDKIMFFFWFTYLLAIASFGAIMSDRAGFVNRGSKLTFIGLLVAIGYGIAYWFIYKFA